MPLYEYECQKCGKPFERLVRSAADEREMECPACGGHKVTRKPSVFAAHAAARPTPLPRGACGRCGDPNGPCGVE